MRRRASRCSVPVSVVTDPWRRRPATGPTHRRHRVTGGLRETQVTDARSEILWPYKGVRYRGTYLISCPFSSEGAWVRRVRNERWNVVFQLSRI